MIAPKAMSTLLLLLALSGADDFERVAAASHVSPRPAACRPSVARWEHSSATVVRRYCRALARGYSSLSTAPEKSLGYAEQALRYRPRSDDAFALRARALVRLERYSDALADFTQVEARSPAVMEAAYLDYARALAAVGRWEDADTAYRRALPIRALLRDGDGPAAVMEAAAAALLGGDDASLERCEGLLWPLLRSTTTVTGRPGASRLLGFVLALRGHERQARELVGEQAGSSRSDERFVAPLVEEMISAWLDEARDRPSAQKGWQQVVRHGGRAAEIARRRLARLGER